jgi:hypothetical protein
MPSQILRRRRISLVHPCSRNAPDPASPNEPQPFDGEVAVEPSGSSESPLADSRGSFSAIHRYYRSAGGSQSAEQNGGADVKSSVAFPPRREEKKSLSQNSGVRRGGSRSCDSNGRDARSTSTWIIRWAAAGRSRPASGRPADAGRPAKDGPSFRFSYRLDPWT